MQSENVNKSNNNNSHNNKLYHGNLLKKFRIEWYLVPKNSCRGGTT